MSITAGILDPFDPAWHTGRRMIVSIGGCGVFDGIFVSGIIGLLLTVLFGLRPTYGMSGWEQLAPGTDGHRMARIRGLEGL